MQKSVLVISALYYPDTKTFQFGQILFIIFFIDVANK